MTPEDKKLRLDNFLVLNRVVIPGAGGYSGIILPLARGKRLIELCQLLDIRISAVDFWCDCNYKTRDERGCPHGYGGPVYDHRQSHFSEMNHLEVWEIREDICVPIDEETSEILEHIDRIWNEQNQLPCLSLGVYLIVPSGWRIPESLDRTKLFF